MITYYFNNSGGRNHEAIFGGGAFFDLDLVGRQANQAVHIKSGDPCVVVDKSQGSIRFRRYIFEKLQLMRDDEQNEVRVLFGVLESSEELQKNVAAQRPDYSIFFDKNRHFKRGSVWEVGAMGKPDGGRFFGEIPGYPPGAVFPERLAVSAAGVHRPTQAGISGIAKDGADSIVVSGGYEDDQDFGDEIIYTGHGGRDKNGKQIADQEMLSGNLALAVSELEGLPVRVIRGVDRKSPFAPLTGYRYDGLFRVESHWHEKGKSGFKMWRFRLVKIVADTVQLIPSELLGKSALTGGNGIPERRGYTACKIVRDAELARNLKKHYNHACQVCGTRIVTADGPYAEAAHIRPLGAPHNGPDTVDNLLCLCPNHHVMFDKGVFSIAGDYTLVGMVGSLTVLPGHNVGPAHMSYHREHYLSRKDAIGMPEQIET